MLVLTRKAGETIHVGGDIFIRVLRTQAGRVRIGIVAPEDVSIGREEIYQRGERQEREKNEEQVLELAGSGTFSMDSICPKNTRPRFPR